MACVSAPASDSIVAVANGNAGTALIDVSNPAMPTIAGNVEALHDEPARDAELADESTGPAANQPRLLYIQYEYGTIRVVDISNPALPKVLSSLAPSLGAWEIEFDSPYLYAAGPWGGLTVVDVSDSANPFVAGIWDGPPGGADVRQVAKSGDYVTSFHEAAASSLSTSRTLRRRSRSRSLRIRTGRWISPSRDTARSLRRARA